MTEGYRDTDTSRQRDLISALISLQGSKRGLFLSRLLQEVAQSEIKSNNEPESIDATEAEVVLMNKGCKTNTILLFPT